MTLGIPYDDILDIMHGVGAVFHLSNVQLQQQSLVSVDSEGGGGVGFSTDTLVHLDLACRFLDLNVSSVKDSILRWPFAPGNKFSHHKYRTLDGAIAEITGLSRLVYARTFDRVLEAINTALRNHEVDHNS